MGVFDGFVGFEAGDFVVGGDDESAGFELREEFGLEAFHVFGHLVGVDDVEIGEIGTPHVGEMDLDFGLVYATLSDSPKADEID